MRLTEENYKYVKVQRYNDLSKVEVLILDDNDNPNSLRIFMKDYPVLRCFVYKGKYYFWNAAFLHEEVADELKVIYDVEHRFVIDNGYIDKAYINAFYDMLLDEMDFDQVQEMAQEYRRNCKKLINKFGIKIRTKDKQLLDKVCDGGYELIEESLNEKFEELNDGIYATKSSYDIINWMKNKPKHYRVVYDKSIKYYFICGGLDYIHQDMLEEAYYSAFYPDWLSASDNRDYTDKELGNNLLFFAFAPKGKNIDKEKSSDGYSRKYVYDFGTIYCHELSPLEKFDIYQDLGEPIKKEDIFEEYNFKKLNEEIEKLLKM